MTKLNNVLYIRSLKASIAVVISIYLSNLVNLSFPFFTALAAIFTIESTINNPFRSGKIRLIGSIVGAIIGTTLEMVSPGNIILCGIGTIIIFFILYLLNLKEASTIACVIFLAIMLGNDIANPLHYSLNRIINTLIGIIIAVIIDYLIPNGKTNKQEGN